MLGLTCCNKKSGIARIKKTKKFQKLQLFVLVLIWLNLLESIRVKVYVNIINKGTLGTINIIYLIFEIIHNKIQLYLYGLMFQPLKRLLEKYFSDSANFGHLVNLLNLKTV